MNNVKISAVIITLNEEKKIQKCINSVKDVVDEIVIIDSFSSDNTEAICKNNEVRFFQRQWDGYGKQKNWGNQQATYDYIFSLDADECVSDGLKNAVIAIKSNWQYDVYSFNRLNYFHGQRLNGIYPDRQSRLFDKRKTQWNENKVHEKLITGRRIKSKHINEDILHFSKENIHEQIDSYNIYSTLSSQGGYDLRRKPSISKLIFSPTFTFIKSYFFKLGFLNGVFGLIFSSNLAYYKFLKYAKLFELYKEHKNKTTN